MVRTKIKPAPGLYLTYPLGRPPLDQHGVVDDAGEAAHAEAGDEDDDVDGGHASEDDIDAGASAPPQGRTAHHQQAYQVGQQAHATDPGDQDSVDDELVSDLLDQCAAACHCHCACRPVV